MTSKAAKKIGRPTLYNLKLAQEICDAIASSELGLCHIVDKHAHFPTRETIFNWIRIHPEFSQMYTKAKEDQTELVVEYMQEVMNEPHRYVDEEGNEKVDVSMLRLKIDTMKWHVAKLKPKKYGETKEQQTNDPVIHEETQRRRREMDERNKKEC